MEDLGKYADETFSETFVNRLDVGQIHSESVLLVTNVGVGVHLSTEFFIVKGDLLEPHFDRMISSQTELEFVNELSLMVESALNIVYMRASHQSR